MLASELIQKLQALVEENGDVEVMALDTNEWGEASWEEPTPKATQMVFQEDDEPTRIVIIL